MSLGPKSPMVGRSPKLKAKWLANTMAYQYGNNGTKKSEIIVLTNNLDQYLQDIFQSIDSKGRGKITGEEFRLLCDVLNLRNSVVNFEIDVDLSFKEFHDRLCEHFACYGDYTGFLVNQSFRAMNLNNTALSNGDSRPTLPDCSKRTQFQKRLANGNNHRCIHDAELFKNWDKLRLSGFRLSEMKENIDQMLYEVAYHKEESQTLKEIIEDLRTMLQASDAQNISMQVALKKYQRNLVSSNDAGHSGVLKSNRHSMPIDSSGMVYSPLKGEEKSVRILSRELTQLRELRDKEVKELINFNNQLQHDLTDMSREVCRLEDASRRQSGQLELIVKTYRCCRELFAVCVESFKEVENADNVPQSPTSVPHSPVRTPSRTPSLKRKFSFSGSVRPNGTCDSMTSSLTDNINVAELDADDHIPPEAILIKRLENEISDQLDAYNAQQQELVRLDNEIVMCRRHLQTSNFQVEALETECSRLLSLEDQLVSVFRLLQKGRSQCLSRKTLGQLLLDVIDTSFGDEDQDMTADQFIRVLQKTLSDCPLFLFPG
ncbi:EF-hand and coiled-coil domain-containing protein 1 [Mactra antiquata]